MRPILLILSVFVISGVVVRPHAEQTPPIDWALALSSTMVTRPSSVAVDGDGNVFTVGNFTDSLMIGTELLLVDGVFESEWFLSKHASNGTLQWVYHSDPGSSGDATVKAVAVDSWGAVFIAGEFRGTATVGDSVFNSYFGLWDPFIAKVSGDGTFLWAEQGSGNDDDFVTDITTDGDGNAFIVGDFRLGLEFGDALLLCGTGAVATSPVTMVAARFAGRGMRVADSEPRLLLIQPATATYRKQAIPPA